MGALGDGVDQDLDNRIRLCQLLGLDPEETTSVTLRIEAGVGAVVEWRGIRRVPLARLVAALADVVDDPHPSPATVRPEWKLGPDPWNGDRDRGEPPC